MQLPTPAFEVTQDEASVTVHVHTDQATAKEARVAAEGTTFGCFIEPSYLPLCLPRPVATLHDCIPLSEGSTTAACTYDTHTQILHVRLTKSVHGQEFPDLERLRPQLLSDEEQAQMERDAARLPAAHAYGFGQTDPLPEHYVALTRSGQVPYLDVQDPTLMPMHERAARAESLETDKWDEGMYLDNVVDIDGDVAAVVQVVPRILSDACTPPPGPASGPVPPQAAAHAFLVQLLFAYLYEQHASYNDASPESAWTLCKLCRSISCFVDPAMPIAAVLRASYRRALTYPLYRSWALCEAVRKDMIHLLQDNDAQARLLTALQDMDAIFALAPTGTGLAEQVETVLRLVWDTWVAPLQAYVSQSTAGEWPVLARALAAPTKETVGEPGDWDLEVLEMLARESMAEGAGSFV
ncbi:hypothetical protein MCAP1_000541 [Malassezia caprae]|uniref:Shq1 protein domain-containing protein n=1 Tax=Malassezia caprae TaxID=1381934 RepID=A0AAF0IYL9_9BASI|nr:hypothetical protein MCAP1_000541 [Malassezia caprae]